MQKSVSVMLLLQELFSKISPTVAHNSTHLLPTDIQRNREQQTLPKSISRVSCLRITSVSYSPTVTHNSTHRLPRDNQRNREQQMLWKSKSSHREIPVWEQAATDQFDLWQVVPRQVFTPYSHLLISTVFVVVSCVGCLRVTGMIQDLQYNDSAKV